MPLTKIKASNVDSLPEAAVTTHVTTFDDDVIQNNIAMLAFKLASGDSLTKFDMVDQSIWDFADATGIDASASTNETLVSGHYSGTDTGEYQYWQTVLALNIPSAGSVVTDMYLYTGSYTEVPRNNASGIQTGMMSRSGLGDGGYTWTAANGLDANAATNFFGLDGDSAGDYNRINFGASNKKALTKWRYHLSGGDHYATWNVQYSSDGTNWTTASSNWAPRSGDADNDVTFSATAYLDLTLVSVSTTAEATPTTADLVFLLEDAAGTNTITSSGDVRAYVSRNGNANWSSALTLVDEGNWGTNKRIITARNVDISALTGTTDMRWKITTHNQAVGKIARIHAVSLGWS